MSSVQRRVGMLILLALVINPFTLFAQGSSPVTVVGSGIPAPLVQAFATAGKVDVGVSVNGTDAGFAALCKGQADITMATRAISADEENLCGQNSVNFLEFELGYDIMAVVANPATGFGQCFTSDQLNALFAPSTNVTNWNQVSTTNADIPLSLYVPPENTTPNALLDTIVEGVGLRTDVHKLDTDAAIIDAVSTTNGALGVVRLPEAQAAGSKVAIMQLNTTSVGCAAPSADTAEGRTYTGAYRLFVYANSAQVAKVKPLFDAAFGTDSAATVATQGFVAPTNSVYTSDKDILANNKTGRQFSKDVTAFTIPANLVGTISIDGSAWGSGYMTAITGAFVKQYAGVTLNQKTNGQTYGVQQLCNGSIDLITAFADLTAAQQNNCAANHIVTQTYNLGAEAVVLVGHGDFLACLTTDQVTKVWEATSEKTVTKWKQVDASFPDLAITLVAPTLGDPYADLLMYHASGKNLPTREDFAETNADPAYRIAAVGNVNGGMSYMTWLDYQKLSAANQARATLVQVNAGKGCVTPSDATIMDGTYALAQPLLLIANSVSLSRQEVQSLMWYIASDANYPLITANGFTPITFATLPDLRDRLQKDYIQGANDAAAAAIRAAQATPEATGEATQPPAPAATTEATVVG